jgi:ubiquinone/menaquinone biosynthesis C-methylase UbiE
MNRETHNLIKKAYGSLAGRQRAKALRQQATCCGPAKSCCDKSSYSVPDHPVPEAELGLSCGNPVAFSHLKKGDVVLDLGSGAGRDVFLAAQKVGAKGKAIGVDMTPEMLALARRNARKFRKSAGLGNVEFRKGLIEDLPVKDRTVDVVISNCVINLSPDKPQVFREVHRVLKPGGRMIVSDIVLERPLPPRLRTSKSLYTACIAGALQREDYLGAIRAAGFRKVEILSDHNYHAPGKATVHGGPITSKTGAALEGAASSITILAVKNSACQCGCGG